MRTNLLQKSEANFQGAFQEQVGYFGAFPVRIQSLVRKAEWGTALCASGLAIGLHVAYMLHAGGLWRDEVQTLEVAGMPTLGELWSHILHDSFPGLIHLTLHVWTGVGFGTGDPGLRVFGVLIGIAVLGALWINARLIGITFPFFSMVLIGFSGPAVRYGDSIRGYGLGMLFLLLAFGLIWKVATAPSPLYVLLATLASILSVQSLYQDPFLLLAIFLGGLVVTLRHSQWKRSCLLAGIGMVSALSLLPYLETIQRKAEFKVMIPFELNFQRIWTVFSRTLGSGSAVVLWAWVGILILGLGMAVFSLGRKTDLPGQQRDRALFSLTAVLTGVPLFLVFLKILSLPTYEWHYLPLLALLAGALDGLLSLPSTFFSMKTCRVGLVLLIGGLTFFPAWKNLQARQTNGDLIAARLEKVAAKDDLILVFPWYFGGTFQRYYQGTAPWTTVPPLESLKLQRLDLFKQQMTAQNSIAPVIEKVGKTLESGNKVWVVGVLPLPKKGAVPPETPPPPHPTWGWNHDLYSMAWGMQTAAFIQTHAVEGEVFPPSSDRPVSLYEDMKLTMVKGWRANP